MRPFIEAAASIVDHKLERPCRAQSFSALFRSVTDAKAGGPARTYQKSPPVLAIRCTPNTGKGSPASRILSLFGTVARRPQLTINRVRAH
jgi:hypothetical protein